MGGIHRTKAGGCQLCSFIAKRFSGGVKVPRLQFVRPQERLYEGTKLTSFWSALGLLL